MPIRPETDDLIAFLNSLREIDPYALAELLCIRVPCNETLADHPTVQVAAGGERSGYTFIAPDTFRVGMLGVLNGFCGTIDDGPRKGWGPIAAIYDEGKLLRFERTENSKINQSPITAEKMIEQIKLRVLPPAGNALFETTPEAALAIYERLVEILYPAPEQQP